MVSNFYVTPLELWNSISSPFKVSFAAKDFVALTELLTAKSLEFGKNHDQKGYHIYKTSYEFVCGTNEDNNVAVKIRFISYSLQKEYYSN